MSDRKEIIEPVIVRGTRDFTPQQMLRRNAVMGVMRQVFERFGYTPLETPILSPAETILGKYGDEGDQLTYAFTDRGDRKLALPYDLTVPVADRHDLLVRGGDRRIGERNKRKIRACGGGNGTG